MCMSEGESSNYYVEMCFLIVFQRCYKIPPVIKTVLPKTHMWGFSSPECIGNKIVLIFLYVWAYLPFFLKPLKSVILSVQNLTAMYQTISWTFSHIMRSIQTKLYAIKQAENRSEIRARIEVQCSLRIPICTRSKKRLYTRFPTMIFPICERGEFFKF